jgi:hypothetical protein
VNYNRLNGVIKQHPIAGLGRAFLLMLNDIVLKPRLSRKRKMSCKNDSLKNNILSRVLVTETGFGLVIGFINHSQVLTTITYNTS